MQASQVLELEVPNLGRKAATNTTSLTGDKFWEVSRWQEIENLTSQKYIEEVKA